MTAVSKLDHESIGAVPEPTRADPCRRERLTIAVMAASDSVVGAIGLTADGCLFNRCKGRQRTGRCRSVLAITGGQGTRVANTGARLNWKWSASRKMSDEAARSYRIQSYKSASAVIKTRRSGAPDVLFPERSAT